MKTATLPKFLSVLDGQTAQRPPVWFMRQAGRYLPEYRALRAEKGGFLELVNDSAAAADVTLQPIRRFGFDGAILFSDILVIPHALGQDLWFEAGEGPRLAPKLVDATLNSLTEAPQRLLPVIETVRQVAQALPPQTTFLGFAGSPWTVATYMVAGQGSREQAETRRFAYRDPAAFEEIINAIGTQLNGYHLDDAAIDYLEQTPLNSLDPHNILDAQGIRKITEITAKQNVFTNELRQKERMDVGSQNLAADEAVFRYEQQRADAVYTTPVPLTPIADSAGNAVSVTYTLNDWFGAKVTAVAKGKSDVTVTYEQGGESKTETFDKLIVAVGRRPYTDKLGADVAGVALDERGFVKIDKGYKTSAAGIYAVGDVTGGAMLAHKAIEEGVVLVEQLHGEKSEVNYNAIPSVIYTSPEIAWVGMSEEQAKAAGFEVKTGSSPFAANGRARAIESIAGQVKFVSDAKTDRVLGVHMIGPYVSELCAEAVLALEFAATTQDIQLTMHGHPSLSETFHEAALAVDGHAIHSANKKR